MSSLSISESQIFQQELLNSFKIIYRPEDLNVKVENNQLVISAMKESKEAWGGTRTRVFEQKFSLPPGVDPANVKSNVTRDNVLVVTAAKEGYQDGSIKAGYVDTKALNTNPEELVIETIENNVVEEAGHLNQMSNPYIMNEVKQKCRDVIKTTN